MRSVCTEQKVTQKENSKKWFLHNFDVYPGWYVQEVISSPDSSPHCLASKVIVTCTWSPKWLSMASHKVIIAEKSAVAQDQCWCLAVPLKAVRVTKYKPHCNSQSALFSPQRPSGTRHRLE